jgi:hypothetical protein
VSTVIPYGPAKDAIVPVPSVSPEVVPDGSEFPANDSTIPIHIHMTMLTPTAF